MVLEKTLESPLDCKEIQPVHPKGDQSWVFIGRTDVEPMILTSPALVGRFFTTSATWEASNFGLNHGKIIKIWASLVAQSVKNLPAMQETLI